MFDVSFTELLVIGVIALVVIGPERLPKVARTVGHLMGRAQRYVNDVKNDIRREVELDDLRKFKTEMEDAAQGLQSSLRDTEAALRTPAEQLRNELEQTAREATGALAPGGSDVANTIAPPAPAQAPAAPSAEAEPAATPVPHSKPTTQTGTPT